jgi:hypothetical protein
MNETGYTPDILNKESLSYYNNLVQMIVLCVKLALGNFGSRQTNCPVVDVTPHEATIEKDLGVYQYR